MVRLKSIWIFTFLSMNIVFSSTGFADSESHQERWMNSVVKIDVRSADVFTADPDDSHGTGFFIGIDANRKGVIFTNRHVIEADPLQIQKITLEFNTGGTRGERIDGRVVFISQIHDFAVLEFDPSQLKRARLDSPIRFPSPKSVFYDFKKNVRKWVGTEVLAIGNPFDSANVTTYGQLTGLRWDFNLGPLLQTQTPINPGNSGGPLISLATGELVGMNTSTYEGADGTHFSIPAALLQEEYNLWRKQKATLSPVTVASHRRSENSMLVWSEEQIELLGWKTAIETEIPGYFDREDKVLVFSQLNSGGPIQAGDVLLRFDGAEVPSAYHLRRELSRSQISPEKVELTVVRQGKVLKIFVEIDRVDLYVARNQLDFVYLSGLLLQSLDLDSASEHGALTKSRVVVQRIVDSAETNFQPEAFPAEGSVIVGISFGGPMIEVHSLLDLKLAVRANQQKGFAVLHVLPAELVQTANGIQTFISPLTKQPVLSTQAHLFVIPMREVLTPRNFSIHQFRKQFRFTSGDAHTRSWRDFVKPCEAPLVVSAKAQSI